MYYKIIEIRWFSIKKIKKFLDLKNMKKGLASLRVNQRNQGIFIFM